MKKRTIFPVFLLVLAFALAGCSVKKEEVHLEALGENGAIVSGVNPCSTEEEVRKAGIPLGEEPFDTQSEEEKGLESVTYLVQDEKFAFDLAGCEIKNSFFQFVNGKLSNITMELPDGVSYGTAAQKMIELYGDPVNGEKVDENSAMAVWEFPGEYPVRAAVIGRLEEEQLASASFQVSYVWFGEDGLFSIDGLQKENGEFQYKDIPFGTSSEEVLSQISAEFEKMESESSSAVSYYTKEKFQFSGCDATLFLEFNEDKLNAVYIQFALKEGEEQFAEILDELTGLYGEPDEVSGGENDIFTSEIYFWGKDTDSTRLQADLTKARSNVSARIGVFALE